MKNQMGLFDTNEALSESPLAFRHRPTEFQGFIGQKHIQKKLQSVKNQNLTHIVFYGPPGTGKTTLANILAKDSGLELYSFNAVLGGVNDLRKLITSALELKSMSGKKSIIFIDEIHRFNKAQQDALLPYLEQGDFILFGATTEYPQTSLNKAILSRVQVWPLYQLQTEDIKSILLKTCEKENIIVKDEILNLIAEFSNGDARSSLNNLEIIFKNYELAQTMTLEEIKSELFNIKRNYDKNSDRHYDVISAFIKSVRGSDENAAILWLAVMLEGGEDPDFIARRLIILASEDIGNADPRGLQIATDCHYAIKQIGMPEARIILAQATAYLARAPKSNASYLAINEALSFVENNPTIEVPTHLRNHHPDKSKYIYPHNYPNHYEKQEYLPKNIKINFFESSGIGYEKLQDEYLDKIKR